MAYPSEKEKSLLCARRSPDEAELRHTVRTTIDMVRREGDTALKRFSAQWDGVVLSSLAVTPEEWAAAGTLSPAFRSAVDLAIRNITRFHAMQREPVRPVDTLPGVRCWRRAVPIARVGLYVPGGSAPLFSTLLMLGIPAQLAGCPSITVCTPPGKDGLLHPAILYAAQKLGIRNVFKTGGAQAIAAMACGTESIPAVDKVFGPGNRYVTCAKELLQAEGLAIDLPAGPSEVAVLADDAAVPAFVAADLLAQAEHAPDAQVLLVSDSKALPEAVATEIERQLPALPRQDIARRALVQGRAVLLHDLDEGMAFLNAYAPEHLILHTRDAVQRAEQVTAAGSVFIGPWSPESVGDYASGTNHTLPTGGHARAWSGVSLDSFMKKITFQQLTPRGLQHIGPAVCEMARAEGLEAHARAVAQRLEALTEQEK